MKHSCHFFKHLKTFPTPFPVLTDKFCDITHAPPGAPVPAYHDKHRGNTVPLQQRERHARRNDRQIRAGSASKRAASVSSGGAVSDGRWQTEPAPTYVTKSIDLSSLPLSLQFGHRAAGLCSSPGRPGTLRGRPGNTAGSPGNTAGSPGNTAGSPGNTAGSPREYRGVVCGTLQGRTWNTAGSPREHRGVAQGTPSGRPGNTAGSPREHRRVAQGTPRGRPGNTTGSLREYRGVARGTPQGCPGNTAGLPREYRGVARGTPRGRPGNTPGSPREHRRVAQGIPWGRPGNTGGSPREYRGVAQGTQEGRPGNTAWTVNISLVVTSAGGDWAGIGDCYVDKANGAVNDALLLPLLENNSKIIQGFIGEKKIAVCT